MKILLKTAVLSIIFFQNGLFAQDSIFQKEHRVSFQPQFFQIKEAANYGLVFNGLNLIVGYEYTKMTEQRFFSYKADLGFGANFNKGVGLNWHFKPVDLFYGFEIVEKVQKKLHLGPYLGVNYRWQVYPELQSGHMFWFSIIDMGPKVVYRLPFGNKHFRIAFSNSVVGFAARPVPATETHFYSLQFSDFFSNAHKNLKLGSYDIFNHTSFELEWLKVNKKRLSIAYQFEYFTYYKNPKLSYLTHSFNFSWKIEKRKKDKK